MNSRFRVYDLALAGMFAALMAIGANLTSWLPFLQVAGVPLSMAPFFAVLAGLLLGSRMGALSMIVYALIGAAGAPVFASFKGGFNILIGSTGGFILSYIAAAYIAGKIIEMKKQPGLPQFFAASFAGIAAIYFIGTTYMYFAVNYLVHAKMTYAGAWQIMAWFMVKDIAFTVLAAFIAPRIYYAVSKPSRRTHRAA